MKSDYNQSWVKDAIRVPSYVNEVKGHVLWSRVIWGQIRWKMLFFVIWVSFEKLKSVGTKFGSKMQYGFLCMLMRSKVMYQSQGSSKVKLGGKCKICNFLSFLWKVEVRLQPLLCSKNLPSCITIHKQNPIKIRISSFQHHFKTWLPMFGKLWVQNCTSGTLHFTHSTPVVSFALCSLGMMLMRSLSAQI